MEKVLIITPFSAPNIGGCETFLMDLAKILSKKYLVHISTTKWEKPIIWQGMDFKKALKLICKLVLPTRKLIKKHKYEKVYALGLISAFVCVLLRIKFSVVILALYDFTKENLLYKFILNRADKVFVEGERGKSDILKVGVKENKIVMFQHWVDQGRFFPTKHTNENLKILFVGRPIFIKGKHIIEACQKITSQYEVKQITIPKKGDMSFFVSPQKEIIYEYIENVPYENLAVYYQMADVCVVPSLYSEGFSRVVVEAASCGCVLITSNYGALPEMVSKFGYCIEPTPTNFAEIITNLNKNRWLLKRKRDETIIHAVIYFGEPNANCFLL